MTKDDTFSGIVAVGFFVITLILCELWIVGAKPTRATKYFSNMRRGFKNVDLKRFQKKSRRTIMKENNKPKIKKEQPEAIISETTKEELFFVS